MIYPDLDFHSVNRKLNKNKYFYLKRNITEKERLNLWSLGEKGILFESTQTRIYPHKNLFSHLIGQIDVDNNGISGIEKSFDNEIKSKKEPIKLQWTQIYSN